MRWIVPDYVPAGVPSLISGDGGVGKGTLLIQLAVAGTTETTWLGMPVAQGPVIYFSPEDSRDELGRRVRAVAGGHLSRATSLHLLGKEDLPDPVLGVGRDGVVTPTETFRRLLATAEKLRAGLVIADPVAELFAIDENRRAEAAAAVRLAGKLCEASGAAVVLVSHPSLTGLVSGSGTSGSTAWNGAVRARLFMTAPDKRNTSLRRLEIMKSNFGPTGKAIDMRYVDGRFIRLTPRNDADVRQEEKGIDDLFVRLLARVNAEGRSVSPVPSRIYAPTIFAATAEARGVKMKAFEQAMDRLLAAGRIVVREDGPPSKRRRHLIVVDGVEASNPPSNLTENGSNPYSDRGANPPSNASNPPANPLSFQPPIPPGAGTAARLNADRPGSRKKAVRLNGHGGSDARGLP
jgi:RecA-family ATPase